MEWEGTPAKSHKLQIPVKVRLFSLSLFVKLIRIWDGWRKGERGKIIENKSIFFFHFKAVMRFKYVKKQYTITNLKCITDNIFWLSN